MKKLLCILALVILAALPASAQPLYNADSPMSSLFSDPPKPSKIGDMINILVDEDMTTAKIDDLSQDRALTTSASSGGGISGFLSSILGNNGLNLGGSNNERTTRSDRFTTVVATQVVAIMPNGYLQVEGIRDIKVNSDKLNVAISGIVRPRDISRDGDVQSDKVSEFQMAVKRQTHRGILDNLFRILF